MNVNLFFVLLFFCFSMFSQQKFEKEYRVELEKIPTTALEFVKSINFNKKIKWYAEESNEGKSFEAKTCFNKNLYSIEFSEAGILLDIEKKVSFSKIDPKQKIAEELSKLFVKFKIKKTQVQFKGIESELKNVFLTNKRDEIKAKISYELIVKGKKDNNYELYEILFDENGNLIKVLQFASINSLNLEF